MSVQVTEQLGALGFSWKTVARVASGVATGGASELAWNKDARNAIAKVAEKVACPIAKTFKDAKVAAAASSTGYGAAAAGAAAAVAAICPKSAPAPIVVAPPPWYKRTMPVLAVALVAGGVFGGLYLASRPARALHGLGLGRGRRRRSRR